MIGPDDGWATRWLVQTVAGPEWLGWAGPTGGPTGGPFRGPMSGQIFNFKGAGPKDRWTRTGHRAEKIQRRRGTGGPGQKAILITR